MLKIICSLLIVSNCYATRCTPKLWPVRTTINSNIAWQLEQDATKLLQKPMHPIAHLSSAGKGNIADQILIITRTSLQDADRAALLALAYYVTQNEAYLNKTKEILHEWSLINQPTGNPIDETRLAGMLWAYDLIYCDLTRQEVQDIFLWFKTMRARKQQWHFSVTTNMNNHRVHQLKMLFLLDTILGIDTNYTKLTAIKYVKLNLNASSGVSQDYIQRHALFYHNYVLQPWLEINLLTGCCEQFINPAMHFLTKRILSGHLGEEFVHSSAKIDAIRAQGGFVYATIGGKFDVTKAAPTIIAYYTVNKTTPNAQLWRIQQAAKPSPWLQFLRIRRSLWQD